MAARIAYQYCELEYDIIGQWLLDGKPTETRPLAPLLEKLGSEGWEIACGFGREFPGGSGWTRIILKRPLT